MKLFNESFLCAVVKFLSVCFCRLPYQCSLIFGRMIGFVFYYLIAKKRAVVQANLRVVLSHKLLPKEIRRLSREVFQNITCNFIDLLCLAKIKEQGFEKILTFEGRDNIEQALSLGKGCLFLAIHSGSWELGNLVASMSGHPYSVVVNEQEKTPRLNEILNIYRRLGGAKVIPSGVATREIIRALEANEIVSLVLDQGGKDGVPVDFFGKTASMSTGAIRLGLKYQTPLCPVWIERQAGGKHVVKILPILKLQISNDIEKDIAFNTQKAVKIFEDLLRAHPQEALWFYKTYKYTTQADVLVLDDGKTGHLRQSQAVAETLKVALNKENKQTRIKTMSVVFNSSWHQKLLAGYSFLAQFLSFLRKEDALRFFLKKDSYQALVSFAPDYIISCGSQTSSVNFILSKSRFIKAIHILKPGILNYRWLSLLVLPEYDKPRGVSWTKLALTKTAPNLITPQYLAQEQEKLFLRYSSLRSNVRSKIGLLLGGNTKGVAFDVFQIRLLIRQLKDAAEHYNMDILVTSSRRTPADVDQMLIKELRRFNRCALLVIPNEANIPEAVGGILASSDILIVSGESISMVSEALSSGKKTIVFSPSGDYSGSTLNKYNRFVLGLSQEGYLLACSIKDISNMITRVMSQKIFFKSLEDKSNLLKKIESIV